MNDMHHLNAKLLSSIDKSNHENKMLRYQLSTFNDCSCRPKCNQTQQKRCLNMKTVKATPDVTLQHAGPKPVEEVYFKSPGPATGDTECVTSNKECHDKKSKLINVVCDSIPMYIDKSKFKDVCSVQLSKSGATVNEAVDYIQDKANEYPDVLTVIHTGTRNLIRDSATTLVRRFERLETNIRNKKVRIAFSSIVHRNDRDLRGQIIVVNKAIKSICARNNWTFIDNDNIDESCLWKWSALKSKRKR